MLALTHVLELPRDLQIPDQKGVALFEPRGDVFVEWPDDARAAFIGLERSPVPGASPVYRVIFRRVLIRSRLPLEAADHAFDRFTRPLGSRRDWMFRRLALSIHSRRGFREWVTVAAVTHFIQACEWPSERGAQIPFLHEHLRQSVSELNRLLIALGLVRGNAAFGALAVGDLPALCPVVIEAAPMIEGRRVGASFVYPVHSLGPSVLHALDDGSFENAVELWRREYHGAEPFFLFYELMQYAGAAWLAERYAQEITNLATAIEVLFSVIIREASIAFGEAPEVRAGVLASPLRNQIEHHITRYAGVAVDLESDGNSVGKWWLRGYGLRNRVVHDGYRPKANDVTDARHAAFELIAALKNGLSQNSATQELNDALAWDPLPEPGTTPE